VEIGKQGKIVESSIIFCMQVEILRSVRDKKENRPMGKNKEMPPEIPAAVFLKIACHFDRVVV
jgi:hypothetical protein